MAFEHKHSHYLQASKTHRVSLLGLMLQDAGHTLLSGPSPTETEERLKEVGIIFFGATMVLHPDVQLRAQQELDTILGQVTLPTIKDQERLPYIRSVVEEVLRMYPVVPLGKDFLKPQRSKRAHPHIRITPCIV
ncbi:cytochrome P450 family, partial [Rhizoctonia solani]|uniref:Cytochrome P450 family n=1 Tax=Rhizoctonia solani TaxID=456999 RepID=A0A8H7IKE7_9AGAM